MTQKYRSDQEKFWAGNFGDEYTARNNTKVFQEARDSLLSKALTSVEKIETAIEFGANTGLNILAIKKLFPETLLTAIEINSRALSKLRAIEGVKVIHGSILDKQVDSLYDLVLSVGVLIHVDPEFLPLVYQNIYAASSRYILIGEYYSSQPTMVSYRGHENRLFKRDFAGELLDIYGDLSLVDYGFCYHRDPNTALDDITWFLLEKLTGKTENRS